ncbi:hypothetical protein AMJ44_00755 [candidate division WOR-1 bacterium DG_54_3]|uniref:Uncharacterized protein n=1 Tax=candidate division WOR-1 bacterium DG_54_3 TaxID=1703775 RepID=A0A0S7Y5V8_UNCSA|nr:MAG: hypothetical protein AMJ44_00755 [candidate division WOR-1 bacterium DG_54_3]
MLPFFTNLFHPVIHVTLKRVQSFFEMFIGKEEGFGGSKRDRGLACDRSIRKRYNGLSGFLALVFAVQDLGSLGKENHNRVSVRVAGK